MTARRTRRLGQSRPVRTFAIEAGVILAVFTTVAFLGIFLRTETLVMEGVRHEAESYLELVLAVRNWNASHGGVWVPKTEASPENPFLRSLGVDPDTSTASGLELTLRNHAPMTTELSRYVAEHNDVTFRLTSLRPVNPENAPTAWERQQLTSFTENTAFGEQIETRGGKRYYQLMRPLVVESECLKCHASQGYHVGDIRGGVTVTLPLAAHDRQLRFNAVALVLLFIFVMTGVGFLMYQLFFRMAVRVDETEEQLRTIATTDVLTGLPNRRAVLDRLHAEITRSARDQTEVGVASIDVDFFKSVNDTHGHAAGDAVLRGIAERLERAIREYDTVGRIGGEEFLVVAPDVDDAQLAVLGERLRAAVAAVPVREDHTEIPVTISVGLALWTLGTSSDEVLRRADDALYRAKQNGRNRVEHS